MKYDDWIERERKFRIKILHSSPMISQQGIYRVCLQCQEICLCHEEQCANCDSEEIIEMKLLNPEKNINEFIRCRFRFNQIFK